MFDFDYERIIDFKKKLRWAQFLFVPPCWISTICCTPCFINQNVEWHTRAQHLALTVDGIKYVVGRHPSQCGLSCSDVGKASKTVPYDKITDCDVQEPAGTACCCCIENVLSAVQVDTASSGGGGEDGVRHELVLEGLVSAEEFKRAVWRVKRDPPAPRTGGPAAAGAQLSSAPQQSDMNTGVLTEIRDELREMNKMLRQQRVK